MTKNCEARVDTVKRRLTLIYHNHVREVEEVQALFAEIEEHFGDLLGGFDLITVYTSALGPLSDGEIHQCRAAYSALVAAGLRNVVRVVEKGCGAEVHLIDALAREVQADVLYAADLDDAAARLDALPSLHGVAIQARPEPTR